MCFIGVKFIFQKNIWQEFEKYNTNWKNIGKDTGAGKKFLYI